MCSCSPGSPPPPPPLSQSGTPAPCFKESAKGTSQAGGADSFPLLNTFPGSVSNSLSEQKQDISHCGPTGARGLRTTARARDRGEERALQGKEWEPGKGWELTCVCSGPQTFFQTLPKPSVCESVLMLGLRCRRSCSCRFGVCGGSSKSARERNDNGECVWSLRSQHPGTERGGGGGMGGDQFDMKVKGESCLPTQPLGDNVKELEDSGTLIWRLPYTSPYSSGRSLTCGHETPTSQPRIWRILSHSNAIRKPTNKAENRE
uniref:Uncharacterized protein n=1 Tax=Knipowitschia caucasica TaxID=637954 RepID=A0AAV2LAQ0_KNICA